MRNGEAKNEEASQRMGGRWWMEVKSRRSEVDVIARAYNGVGCDDNDVISSVACCQLELKDRNLLG